MSHEGPQVSRPRITLPKEPVPTGAAELPRLDAELPPVRTVTDGAVRKTGEQNAQATLLDNGVKRFFKAHPELLDGFRDPQSLRLPGEFLQYRANAREELRTANDRREELLTDLQRSHSAGRKRTLESLLADCNREIVAGHGDEPYVDREVRGRIMREQQNALATYRERLAKAFPDGQGGINYAVAGARSMNEIHAAIDPAKYHRRPTIGSMPASALHLDERPGATRDEVLAYNKAEAARYERQQKLTVAAVKADEERKHQARFGANPAPTAAARERGPQDPGQRLEWLAAQTRITTGAGTAADHRIALSPATDWSRNTGALQVANTQLVGESMTQFHRTLALPKAGTPLGEAFIENLARQTDPSVAGASRGDASQYRTACVKAASAGIGAQTGKWLESYASDPSHRLSGMNEQYYRSLFVDHLNASLSGKDGIPGVMTVRPGALSQQEYNQTWNSAHVAALRNFSAFFSREDTHLGTGSAETVRDRYHRTGRGAEFESALEGFRKFVTNDQYLTREQRTALLSSLPRSTSTSGGAIA